MRSIAAVSILALALAAPHAAQAQGGAPAPVIAPENVLDGDRLTIGAGAVYGPSYEGSDDNVFSPFPLIQGSVRGVGINPRPGGAALDLVPDGRDAKVGLQIGPLATYSGNRRRQIEDPVVRNAGRLKAAIDLGVNAGFSIKRLLNTYDALTLSADAKWNVNEAHRGAVITPQISYATPVSRGALVVVGASAKHVDDAYADYYYSVSPAQNQGSGLPLFQANGGWVSYGGNALVAVDLDGDLTNGGFAVFALGSYSRLRGDAKRTPYTALRGDADQWNGALGVAYTF